MGGENQYICMKSTAFAAITAAWRGSDVWPPRVPESAFGHLPDDKIPNPVLAHGEWR